jgi:hypothetical protein
MKRLQISLLAALLVGTMALGTISPAKADGAASTRNIILGAAALAAGIIVSNNVAQKNAAANTITGYTPDGAAVYNDGHVVLPNGQSYYPGNYGQQIACNDGSCSVGGGNGYRGDDNRRW